MYQLRSTYYAFYALLLATVIGCTALGLASPQTFEEKALAAVTTVDEVQKSATVLLAAKKISSTDAENALKVADISMAGISVARTYAKTDPAAAQNRLTAIVIGLTAIQTYLATHGASK